MAWAYARVSAAHRCAVDSGTLRICGGDIHRHRLPGRLVRNRVLATHHLPVRVCGRWDLPGIAAIWSYRARDGLATAVHGIWAAFWLGWGFLQFLIALKLLPAPARGAAVPEVGYWFFVLAAITGAASLASLAESLGLFSVLLPLTVGSALLELPD